MATNKTLITQMMNRLGQRKSERIRSNVVEEINLTIEELEQDSFIPWFLQKTASITINANESFASLPVDFIREREETLPYTIVEGKIQNLEKKLLGELQNFYEEGEFPKSYALYGNEIHIRPVPKEDISINIFYYATSSVLVQDNDEEATNLWLLNAKNYLFFSTLKVIAALHIRDEVLAQSFQSLESTNRRKLYTFHESRIHENQDYYVGGSSGT